jgi:methylase of polypeptide subunit release factors
MNTSHPAVIGSEPFHLDATFDAPAFGAALEKAGYNRAGLAELMRTIRPAEPIDLALLDRRTRQGTPFATLARLFRLGMTASPQDLQKAIAPVDVEELLEAGIVQREGDELRASARIDVHRDLLVCSDFVSFLRDVPLANNHVLGVGPGALSLGALTPQSPVESALDLGTGGGIQALLAAQHAERVVATDICPRALNFAAMNARLNGIENIELRAGSFFDPVAGEKFDRIVANPPFVISPSSKLVYRDGGLQGDEVCELVTRGLPAHLEEGGFGLILLNWHHQTKDDWKTRPSAWTEGNGCDVRWMHFDDEDPASYAASWLRQEERPDAATAARMLDEWIRYYESVGIRQIALGAVVMQKCSDRPNWLRCDHIPLSVSLEACGDQIERVFAAEDLLHRLENDRQLLSRKFKLHPGHRLEQQLTVRDSAWKIESNKLHITDGIDFCAQIDMPTMTFLAALDGTRTVREATKPIAQSMNRKVEDIEPVGIDITKRMLRLGLLVSA